jgi:hypothetical protein
MAKNLFCGKVTGMILIFMLFLITANPAEAAVTPTVPFQASALSDPDPAVFAWNSSIAYYDNWLIYAGADKNIYAYDLDTGLSALVCDTSGLSDPYAAVSGFLVSNDNYLYFHENTFPTTNLYRVDLTDPDNWPADYEELDTGCEGSIFTMTQNPWTDAIWFASADLGSSTMYLYEVNSAFTGVTQRASFPAPNFGGNGPILFKGATTLLYGESVWGGDGYFHLVDSTTGEVTTPNYLILPGGLAGACYGYNNVIYASTGAGSTIYEIQGTTMTEVATTDEDAQGMVFDGSSFYISEQKSSDFSGAISFHQLWDPSAEARIMPVDPYSAASLPDPDPAVFA